MNACLFAETIDLNFILESFDKQSNFIKKIKNNKSKVEIQERGIKQDKWKKVDGKVSSSYAVDIESKNDLNENDHIQNGYIEGEISYKDFFIRTKYDYSTKEYQIVDDKLYKYPHYYVVDELAIGYKKVLNDIIYSETDYNLNIVLHEKKRVDYENQNKLIEKKEELIDKYVEIKNYELEKALKESQLHELKKTLAILELKLIENEVTNIDFNIMKLEIAKLKQEINFLENKTLTSKKNLFNLCGIENEPYEFKELEKTNIETLSVSDSSLKALEYTLNIENENLKYLKRQKQWPVEFFTFYESVNDQYQIGLNFNFDLFEYHSEEKQKKQDIENVQIDIEDEKLNITNKNKERKNELEFLEENTKTYEELYNVYLSKYNLTQELYTNGDIGLLDYLKTQTETYKINVEYLKVKNNYYALLYKISIN